MNIKIKYTKQKNKLGTFLSRLVFCIGEIKGFTADKVRDLDREKQLTIYHIIFVAVAVY